MITTTRFFMTSLRDFKSCPLRSISYGEIAGALQQAAGPDTGVLQLNEGGLCAINSIEYWSM